MFKGWKETSKGWKIKFGEFNIDRKILANKSEDPESLTINHNSLFVIKEPFASSAWCVLNEFDQRCCYLSFCGLDFAAKHGYIFLSILMFNLSLDFLNVVTWTIKLSYAFSLYDRQYFGGCCFLWSYMTNWNLVYFWEKCVWIISIQLCLNKSLCHPCSNKMDSLLCNHILMKLLFLGLLWRKNCEGTLRSYSKLGGVSNN